MATDQTDNIESLDDYMLHSRSEIMQKLRQLGKRNTLMTLHFDDHSMLSAVVDVLADRNLLVLDYGSDEALNQKLIKHNKAIVKTDLDGITAQFTINKIQKARLKGKSAFACPLPDKVLWVQRRESYRVKIPLSEKVTCELTHGDELRIEYPVLDISTGGIGLFDKNGGVEFEPGNTFNNCKLTLGEHKTMYINIEIRNHIPINPNDESKGTRCGCDFLNMNSDFDVCLQKFINMVEMQQNR